MAEADVLRVILSLIAVVVLLLAAAWLTRRAGLLRTGNTQGIKVLGMQNLGGRGYLAVVQVENTRLVLGITSTQINVLHTLSQPGVNEPPAADTPNGGHTSANASSQTGGTGAGSQPPVSSSMSARFSHVLGKALKGR